MEASTRLPPSCGARRRGLSAGAVFDLPKRPLDLGAKPLGIFRSNALWVTIEERVNSLERPATLLQVADHAMKEPGARLVRAEADAAVANVLEEFGWQARLVGRRRRRRGARATGRARAGRRRLGRERRHERLGIPYRTGTLDDACRLRERASARTLGFRWEVWRARYAIGLGDDARVSVRAGHDANCVADQLGLFGRDGAVEEIPVVEVPWRRLDRQARAD